MADQEEDASLLPLPDRWIHKNWKIRKEAYEFASKEFDKAQSENDPVVRTFLQDSNLWKSAVSDSNVAAQQEALGSLCSWLQIAGAPGCARTRNLTIVPIVEKGLAATRQAAKQKALEAILLYIELDRPDPIIDELLPILSHKQPKIIAATLSCLREIYHAYGCKTVDPKPTLKLLPKVYGHADKNVRAEAQNLTVELYRWVRDSMKPLFWNDLKPVQQQDLERLFEKVKDDPPPKQERVLRSQQNIKEAVVAGAVADDVIDDDEEAIEPDLELAINVMPNIPKDLLERISSTKWKDRKEALDDLQKAVNCPKIEEGPFDDIVRSLAKCMKDANIAVVTGAANCVELLARGLRKGFSKYRATVLVPMLERLKEKKQAVTDALGQALDAVFAATSLLDVLEDVLEKLKDKNPQVKLESTRFLIRCLQATREAPQTEQVKSIADAATKLLTESQEVQRAAGAEAFGTLWKIMGDRAMGPYMEGLDDIRKAKIKEFYDKAEVKAKYKPKPAAPPKAAGAPSQKRMGPPGMKKPGAGMKRPAAVTATPVAEEPTAAPLAQRPSSGIGKPGMSKVGAPRSGLAPPGGLRPPAGLQKRIPGPSSGASSGAASPARRLASPEDEPQAPQQPKLGLGPGRGLAGRPLGKPTPAQNLANELVPTTASGLAGLSSAERAELDELRAEADHTRRETEVLRSEKAKLSSQIHELTNQNAQLIEDHTRDVLSIKAKETQLVRARSDHEAAESQVQAQQREIERLKRELNRQVRAASPAPVDLSDQIYHDGAAAPGASGTGTGYGGSRTRGFVASPTSEALAGKENDHPASSRQKLSSPPLVGAQFGGSGTTGLGLGTGFGAAASPRVRPGLGAGGDMPRANTTGSLAVGSGGAGGGAESWKRATEVTQNLKARIELMKAKQGLSRPH